MNDEIEKIAINSTSKDGKAGLDSLISGWYSAIQLRTHLEQCNIDITHICESLTQYESEAGVTSLNIQQLMFLRSVGIDEKLLMVTCQAQHTLGKNYLGWQSAEQDFMLVEGDYGIRLNNIQFQHYIRQIKSDTFVYDDYAIAAKMARGGKFVHPVSDQNSPLSTYTYGLNIDSVSFAKQLIEKAKSLGIKEVEGSVAHIDTEEEAIIAATIVSTEGAKTSVSADFFIDCGNEQSAMFSHFSLKHFQQISTSLAANKYTSMAVVANEKYVNPLVNMILSFDFGWAKISTLHGRAIIECYSNSEVSISTIIEGLQEAGITADNTSIVEKTVSQKVMQNSWLSNCLFLGKNSCDIEPLVHNYLDVIDEQLAHFFKGFPSKQPQDNLVSFYNRSVYEQSLSLVDMVVCHYHLSGWKDSGYWASNGQVNISKNLQHIIQLFEQTGIFPEFENQYVIEDIWVNFLIGFECKPEHSSPLSYGTIEVTEKIQSFEHHIDKFLQRLPSYEQYVGSVNRN